jgi:acetoin utilization protein AcuB
MHVRDVMTPNPATVSSEDSLQTARAQMAAHNCRRLPVLDASGHLCGIITDRDLRLVSNSPLIMRERWQDTMLLEHTSVDACMTPDPLTVSPDMPLQDAVALLLAHKISGLPVLDADDLVGILTVTDLLQALQQTLQQSRR